MYFSDLFYITVDTHLPNSTTSTGEKNFFFNFLVMPRQKDPITGKEIRRPRLNQNRIKVTQMVQNKKNKSTKPKVTQGSTGKLPLAYVFTFSNYTEEDILQLQGNFLFFFYFFTIFDGTPC